MAVNPDVYLLYEYMKKNAFTVRVKANLSEPVDGKLLKQAAEEAMTRFPYFSVRVGLDEDENYILLPNDRPIPVLPEQKGRLLLGSEKLAGHLFAITWKEDSIWFNWAHSLCGAFGAMFWIKTTLYQYLTKRYGQIKPPADLKAVGSPVDEEEYALPDPDSFPADEPLKRYEEGNSNVGLVNDILYFVNPFANEVYYYQVELESKAFMEYAKRIDGSPNSILAAIMLKTTARYFTKMQGWHISAKIADDYRKDIGCRKSYRDFVRFIHVKYDWEMEKESIERLNQRARGAIIAQMQPENSFEWYRNIVEARKGIDSQPDLKSRIQYAQKHSIYKSDVRDTYMISYVGQTDWGGMTEYIKSIYTITDGNLMLEVNALPDKFCVTFQLLTTDRKPLDLFCDVLKEEQLPFTVSDRYVRYMPDLLLPNPDVREKTIFGEK
ncbi:MAG: hypothetical protein IJ899_03455 [Blautia sp.]|nr:hypothetical protein [Blautia sp.]